MKYLISKRSFMNIQDIEITEEEFSMLSTSRTVLTTAFRFEEMYEIVISNYLDFEKELVSFSFDHLVRLNQVENRRL